MKKILLLGGSTQQIAAIKAAKTLGYYTVLCDYLEDNPGQYHADCFYRVSTTDRKAILKVAKKEQVNGIISYASDPAAPIAAYVAEKMKLPSNPYKSVDTLCNKDKFRKFLFANGFNAPISKGYASKKNVLTDISKFCFPIIVKPVDSSGSKGITVLYSKNDLEIALELAFNFSRKHRVIVEEFIEKAHPYLIGGDIFIIDGNVVLWGLLNCHRDNRVNLLVPVGKSYPLELEPDTIDAVKHTLNLMIGHLGIRNGSMNVELIVDRNNRVWPIDIGPRSGGNMIPDLLGDMFGIDIAKMSIQAAMGETVIRKIKEPDSCFATHNLHSNQPGIYEDIIFASQIEQYIYRKYLYKRCGDKVEFFDNASKCLGIIFMRFPTKKEMNEILNNINKLIKIKLQLTTEE